ncbi:hypothetical protein EDD11_003593 [Mortierella claussenii]|nr:hypothetical protein EDD11_003593 [Mortierella claussenii]
MAEESEPPSTPQTPRTPQSPRTPPPRSLNARHGGKAGYDGHALTPQAPKTLIQRPPPLHVPTSPTPVPPTRSRRAISSLPPLALAIMGDVPQPKAKRSITANGVGIHEEELEDQHGDEEAERKSYSISDANTPTRLIVSIPLHSSSSSHSKRPREESADQDLDTEHKERRVSRSHRRGLNNDDLNGVQNLQRGGIEAIEANGYRMNVDPVMDSPSVRSLRDRDLQLQKNDLKKQGKSLQKQLLDAAGDERQQNQRTKSNPSGTLVPQDATEMTHPQEIEVEDHEDHQKDPDDFHDECPHDAESGDEDEYERAGVSAYVRSEMEEFEKGFNGLQGKFKLLNKIGEGTFSSVYKAIDLEYNDYDNSEWDYGMDGHPRKKLRESKDDGSKDDNSSTTETANAVAKPTVSKEGKLVAIKRIYVTSSPRRIENEIAILHELSGHKNVVPLITAFRFMDQVIVVLPYFEHRDFREYYRYLPMDDIRCYLRALLRGLAHMHKHGIIHRDIKPSNFLYDTGAKTGLIVDFGLAQRQEAPPKDQTTSSSSNQAVAKNEGSSTQAKATIARMSNTASNIAPALIRSSKPNTSKLLSQTTAPTHSSTTAVVAEQSTSSAPVTGTQRRSALSAAYSTPQGASLSIPPRQTATLHQTTNPFYQASNQAVKKPYGAPIHPPTPLQTSQSGINNRQRASAAGPIPLAVDSQASVMASKGPKGVLRKDPRPVIRVNRGGTRGYRAPEVLFRHTHQTIAIDIWSVGAIFISFLTGRFPFFNSNDDVEAVLEIAVLFGRYAMKKAAATFNRSFSTNVPTVKDRGIPLIKLCRLMHPKRFRPPEGYVTSSRVPNSSVPPTTIIPQPGHGPQQRVRTSLQPLPAQGQLQQRMAAPIASHRPFHRPAPDMRASRDAAAYATLLHPQQPNTPVEQPTIIKADPNLDLQRRATPSSAVPASSAQHPSATSGISVPESRHNIPVQSRGDTGNSSVTTGDSITADTHILGGPPEDENMRRLAAIDDEKHIDMDTDEVTIAEIVAQDHNQGAESGGSSKSKKPVIVGTDSQEELLMAVDLLERMLALDPRRRITAAQALRHPFLRESSP